MLSTTDNTQITSKLFSILSNYLEFTIPDFPNQIEHLHINSHLLERQQHIWHFFDRQTGKGGWMWLAAGALIKNVFPETGNIIKDGTVQTKWGDDYALPNPQDAEIASF